MPDDKPDLSALWPLLPPWIKWVAMNPNHEWWAFVVKPKAFVHSNAFTMAEWYSGEVETNFRILRKYAPKWRGDWRKSLCKRPEGKK